MREDIDFDLATFDRDSLRDEVAYLQRHVIGLREEVKLAEADLAEKERLLLAAEKRLEEEGELPELVDG